MRDIAFVVYPGYSLMALAIVAGFEVANSMVDPEPYDLHYVSERGGLIKTSAGLPLQTERFTDKPFDTLVVGGATVPAPSTHAGRAQTSSADRGGVHRRFRAGRGRTAGRAAGHDPLDACSRTATGLPEGADG
jgi:transcriptional regulator GlxA family with amidase domain